MKQYDLGRVGRFVGGAIREGLTVIRNRILFYRYDDYSEFYLKATKSRVREDPAASVGPAESFDAMRDWQFAFLRDQGLAPEDTLLDVGCGVLRGGIPLIDYLDAGHYCGVDLSADALDVGQDEIRAHGLEDKDPELVRNVDLKFNEGAFDDREFGFVWAQSVITHLPPETVAELLSHVPNILACDGVVYATIWESEDEKDVDVAHNRKDYKYSLEYLRNLARESGLVVERVQSNHPNGLQTIKIYPS